MANKIEQKIDGNENFQQSVETQNITIISQGVSKEEAREISAEMSRKVSNEYFQLSQDLANKRMDSFENTFGTTAPGSMGSDFEVSSSADDLPF